MSYAQPMSLALGVVTLLTLTDASLMFPERRGGFIAAEAQARLVVPIPRWSFGTIADTSVTWHAPFPLAVRLRAWPLSLFSQGRFPSWSPAENAAASLEVLLDTKWFALGAGAGGGTSYDSDPDAAAVHHFDFRVNAVARLGPLDGLHLAGRVHLRLLNRAVPWLAGLEGSLQVPLAAGWWLGAYGGGDVTGVAMGEAGLRIALRPELFFTFKLGFAEHLDVFGPSVGVGVEYRAR